MLDDRKDATGAQCAKSAPSANAITRAVVCAATAAATLAFSSSLCRAAELVTNGSFEADGNVVYDGAGNLPPITGWSVSGKRIDVIPGNQTDGTQYLSFDDGLATSNPPTGTHSGVITQSIATVPGTEYTFSFDYGAIVNAGAFPQKVNAQLIGGTTLLNQTITKNVPIYGSYVYNFVANSTSTTIRFADVTGTTEAGQSDGVLDNVHANATDPLNIAVRNASFEDIDIAANTPNSTNVGRFAGWTVDSPNSSPLNIDDTNNARIQSGKTGTQFMQINNTAATISQTLSAEITRMTNYKLTVGIGVATGDFNAGYISHGVTLALLAQDASGVQTLLASTSISGATINGAPTGVLRDYLLTVPYSSISSGFWGQQLVIQFTSLYTGGQSENIFDNVRFVALPEPTSATLMGAGVALLAWRRRKACA